jgi:Leucine-rich repeat (LRR) protein
LDISKNLIKVFPPQTFDGMVELQKLYLRENKIADLGSNFSTLKSLQELELDSNCLIDLPAELGLNLNFLHKNFQLENST